MVGGTVSQSIDSQTENQDTPPEPSVAEPVPAPTPDLNKLYGIASETEGTYQLSYVAPEHSVSSQVEQTTMYGASILKDSKSFADTFETASGVVRGSEPLANIALALSEAAEVGLDQGYENMNAELYMLDSASRRLKSLVDRVKSDGGPTEQEKEEYKQLKTELEKFKQDFSDHSTAWAFFERAVLTEADKKTLAFEVGTFVKEYYLKDFVANLLGRVGNWFFKTKLARRQAKWTWKALRPELVNAIGKSRWKRWKLDQRVRDFGSVTGGYASTWAAEKLLGEIHFPDVYSKENRIQFISERLENIKLTPRPPDLRIQRFETASPLQAVTILQNIPLAARVQPNLRPVLVEVAVRPGIISTQSAEEARQSQVLISPTESTDAPVVVQPPPTINRSTLHINDGLAIRQANYARFSSKVYDSR